MKHSGNAGSLEISNIENKLNIHQKLLYAVNKTAPE
jgi:hypothetical protein